MGFLQRPKAMILTHRRGCLRHRLRATGCGTAAAFHSFTAPVSRDTKYSTKNEWRIATGSTAGYVRIGASRVSNSRSLWMIAASGAQTVTIRSASR